MLNCTHPAVNPLSGETVISTFFCRASVFVLPGDGLQRNHRPASAASLAPACLAWAGEFLQPRVLQLHFVEVTAMRSNTQYRRKVDEKRGEIRARGCKEQSNKRRER